MELVQEPKKVEELVLVRCKTCGGLRGVTRRNAESAKTCKDCRRGKVVKKSQFHNYWTARFTMQEIEDMAKAIWG